LEGRGDDAPVVDTVFGVFSTAERICGKRTLEFLKADPERTHQGLRKIAASLANYARALVEIGAGIYLAVSGAASDTTEADIYRQNFLAYDQQVLDAASGATINVLHHHGTGLRGYHIFSWSNRLAGNPSIREMRLKTTCCLMSGVDETTFERVRPEEIIRQVKDAIAESGGHSFIVAPGCAVPTPPASPEENLHAIRRGVLE
jgi:uroporphyrinogen decarboxylase